MQLHRDLRLQRQQIKRKNTFIQRRLAELSVTPLLQSDEAGEDMLRVCVCVCVCTVGTQICTHSHDMGTSQSLIVSLRLRLGLRKHCSWPCELSPKVIETCVSGFLTTRSCLQSLVTSGLTCSWSFTKTHKNKLSLRHLFTPEVFVLPSLVFCRFYWFKHVPLQSPLCAQTQNLCVPRLSFLHMMSRLCLNALLSLPPSV